MKLDTNESRILKVIFKLSRGRRLTFHQFTELGGKYGFTKYVNYRLFSIYNTYVSADVNWDTLELDPRKIDTLINKIRFVKDNPNNVIEVFDLDDDFIYNHIDFTKAGIEFSFPYEDRDIGLKILNMEYNQYLLYAHTVGYGSDGGYRPEGYDDGDDRYAIIRQFNDENTKLLAEILSLIGHPQIGKNLMYDHDNNGPYILAATTVDRYLGSKDIFDRIDSEWCDMAQYASEDSIKDAFEKHIEGIDFNDADHFKVPYDFMIKYLKENPDVNTFSELEDHPLIDDELYLEDDYFNYNVDNEKFNDYVHNILENVILDIEADNEDNEEFKTTKDKIKQFNQILHDLKFIEIDDGFSRETPTKIIKIDGDNIDYINGKVLITIIHKEKSVGREKEYEIPFDDITNYVLSKELFERIIKLLGSINEN